MWLVCGCHLGEKGRVDMEVPGRVGGGIVFLPDVILLLSTMYRGKLLVVFSVLWVVISLVSMVHPHLPRVVVLVFHVSLLERSIPVGDP